MVAPRLQQDVLVDPIESSWEILKGLMLKNLRDEPPSKYEKSLIRQLADCDTDSATKILKGIHDENLLVRLEEIVTNCDTDFNVVRDESDSPRLIINSMSDEDGEPSFNPEAYTQLAHRTGEMQHEHYERTRPRERHVSDRGILELTHHKDRRVAALWDMRCRELAMEHPDQFEPKKAQEVARLEKRIDTLHRDPVKSRGRDEKTRKAFRAMMHGKEGDSEHEAEVEEHLWEQCKLQVLKEYYRDRAAYDVIRHMRGEKHHEPDCTQEEGCGCDTVMETKRKAIPLDTEFDEGLQQRARQSVLDLTNILNEYTKLRVRDEGSVEPRVKSIEHWWKETPPDERQLILGSIVDMGHTGLHFPMLPIILQDWNVGPQERDDFLHYIADFEGRKAKLEKRGFGKGAHDPSIIGEWGSRHLYEFLSSSAGPGAYESAPLDPDDSLDTEEGAVEGAPKKDTSTGVGQTAAGDIGVEGGDTTGIPFPTFKHIYFARKEKEREALVNKWVDGLQQRVDDSGGVNPIHELGDPEHLTKGEMERKIKHQKMVGDILTPATTSGTEERLENARLGLAEMKDDRTDAFDRKARAAGVSPEVMKFAIQELAFLRDSKDGRAYVDLREALYDRLGNEKTEMDDILNSKKGKIALTILLRQGKREFKEAGIEEELIRCDVCEDSPTPGKWKRRDQTVDCPKCGDTDTPGYMPLYSTQAASDAQKRDVIEGMEADLARVESRHESYIRDAAMDAGFSEECGECRGIGRDPFDRREACDSCGGVGKLVYVKPFINSIIAKKSLFGTAEEAMHSIICSAESTHSVLNYRMRERQMDKDIANLEKFGIMPDGVQVMLHLNRLHINGGTLSNENLLRMRQQVIEENPNAGFRRIKRAIGERLKKAFTFIDQAHEKQGLHEGLYLRHAMFSPFMKDLLDIMADQPDMSRASGVIEQRLSNHLQKVNHPNRFESRPDTKVCPVCYGAKKKPDYHTGQYLDQACAACWDKRKGRSTGISKYEQGVEVPSPLQSPLLRNYIPACPCCQDGMSKMITHPGGIGTKTRMHHEPHDVDTQTMAILDRLFELTEQLRYRTDQYTKKKEPDEFVEGEMRKLHQQIDDLVRREAPELNKALGTSFREVLRNKTGRDMVSFEAGASALTEESEPMNTPCTFCAERVKLLEPPLPGSDSLDVPNLGDEDGYHDAGFLGTPQGCPNDPHFEDGQRIFEQLDEIRYASPEMRGIIEASWNRGPLISDLQDLHPNIRRRGGPSEDVSYSPIHPQTVGDLGFGRFAALRRRGGKPTPDERFDHKFQSRYIATEMQNSRPTETHLTDTARERYSHGERFLDTIEDEKILEKDDEKLKRLFAIHTLIPDYLGHLHFNPLQLTGDGDNEQQRWARSVLGLKQGETVGAEMKNEFKHNLYLMEPLLVLEKEWAQYYLAPRKEMLEKGWPSSIFNTDDPNQPFLREEDMHRVFGELRGNYRDCQEYLMHGFISPDHHGFMPTTNHFPDLMLFLNNPRCPPELAQAWMDHHPGLSTPGHEWYEETGGRWATEGRNMKEMQPIADMIWSVALGGYPGSDKYPESYDDWMEEQGEWWAGRTNVSTKRLWDRIKDMLERRSSDPEGSKRALLAVLPRRDRGNPLNAWGYATSCPNCAGEGHVDARKFVESVPAFKSFFDENGDEVGMPLDRERQPLPREKGQHDLTHPSVVEFIRDHSRPYRHATWEDHPEHDLDDSSFLMKHRIQCPGCKGTHVCPSCDGHGGYHASESAKETGHIVRTFLGGEKRELMGNKMRMPVNEEDPPELITDPYAALINQMPDDVVEDYVRPNTEAPPGMLPSPGFLWHEEKDDDGKPTGHLFTMRDPWYSNSGGMGTGNSFNRGLQKVTAEEFWEGEAPTGSDEEDRKAAELNETARAMAAPDEEPAPPKWIGERPIPPDECQFPGCKQLIPVGSRFCTSESLREHFTRVWDHQTMELVSSGLAAPNHLDLMNSPRMKAALGEGIPSKNYYGGHEGIQRMLELGFKYEGSTAFGVKNHIPVEKYRAWVQKGFKHMMGSIRQDLSVDRFHLKRQLKHGELTDDEYKEKSAEMEEAWFEEAKDAMAEWQNSLEKLDMHIPYFTHPEDPFQIPHAPFDIFSSGAIPDDISLLRYIPHGFDPNNPQHRSYIEQPTGNLYLRGVETPSFCPACHMHIGAKEKEAGECSNCGLNLKDAELNEDYMHPGSKTDAGNLSWMGPALDAREELVKRLKYIANHMDVGAGEMDPALVKCDRCGQTGERRDRDNNLVPCGHCIGIPGAGRVTFANWDNALVTYHNPDYELHVGTPGGDFRPIKKSEAGDALRALRLGAGGSRLNERLLASDALENIYDVTMADIEHVDEEVDANAADWAQAYLTALTDQNMSLPTLHKGFLSGMNWKHRVKVGDKDRDTAFKGVESAAKKVERLNQQWARQSGGMNLSELLRVTGASSIDDLGNALGPTTDAMREKKQENWKESRLLKNKLRKANKDIKRLEAKPKLNKYEETELADARLLKTFTSWTDFGSPIARINRESAGDKVYRLVGRMNLDTNKTIRHGAVLSTKNMTSAERAQNYLDKNFGENSSSLQLLDGSVFGSAGSVYATAVDNLDKRIEGSFHIGEEGFDRDPQTGEVRVDDHGQPKLVSSKASSVMTDARFTPAALHDEVLRAIREGRDEHAQQYLDHIGSAVKGTGIKVPTLDEVKARAAEPQVGSFGPLGVEGPRRFDQTWNWPSGDEPEGGLDYIPKSEDSPVDVAWGNILKNLKVMR